MMIQSGSPASGDVREASRAIETPDFLNRIAEEMRATSGSDLPLSCFIEQVRLQLAAGKSLEELRGQARESANSNASYQSSDCFRAWAMPEYRM
ncbi:hypothetical protein ACDY96_36410 [Rhizobium mongolense]|uniref:hypothetical protein n=1 Tax=Rhizobium TaxID=379 RepID=UPI00189029CC|nr:MULTISPECIES: hypothetical protein [unclassified Rhizobium]QPB18336.1 hypothetical protein ISN39_11590 [Rhizobium sp. 007]WFU85944.1 hypothetical protein QA644_12305 [Rhizobium sp. CC1099]